MTSAQNHLLQSSGNKLSWVFAFSFLLAIVSCGTFSGGTKAQSKTKDVNSSGMDKSVVDTIKWTKIPEDKAPPIRTETELVESKPEKNKGLKDSYRVACFLPLETNRIDMNVSQAGELRSLKYMQYYAGMKLAMEDLEKEGMSLTLDVYDSKEERATVQTIMETRLASDTDVIMGPIKKDILIDLTKFGKENEIPVISPWYSSMSITKDNPYYIQLTPFLTEHYYAIVDHALANFEPSQIYLLGREGTKDPSRFKYFQEAAFNITKEKNELNEYQFDIDSMSYEYELFKKVISPEGPTVFIIPNFASKDAQYVYDVIRRINVEKMGNEVYIYGMPMLYSMDKLTYEYYTNMNVRIALSRFTQRGDAKAQFLAGRFVQEYNDFPADELFEGYDNMMYLGRALDTYGTDFINHLDGDKNEYLSTKFDLQPIISTKGEKETLDYYENKNLRIVQFKDDRFTILPN